MFLLFAAEELNEKLDKILEYASNLEHLSEKTFWHHGVPEFVFDSMAFIASMTALGAIITVYYKYRQYERNKDCKSQILGEIVRYLYVNDTIIEIIRLKMEERGWERGVHPHEAIIRRFKFPDKDLDISDFAMTAKNYNKVREFQLFMRNYNIMVDIAAKHFEDENVEKMVKVCDLAELQHRSHRLLDRIYGLKAYFNLSLDELEEFIPANHRADFTPDDLTLTPEEKKAIEKMTYIPEQYKNIADHYRKSVANRYFKYYDIEMLPLKRKDSDANCGPYSKEVVENIQLRKYHHKPDNPNKVASDK